MKYAHPTGVPLELTIGCRAQADSMLVIDVADDGIGLPEGFDVRQDGGLGFRIIRSLAEQIGASLEISSSPLGLCFRIALPAVILPQARIA